MPELMKVNEVAERWRVSKMTVYRLVESGALRAIKVGQSIRIAAESVEEYEKNSVQTMNRKA